MELSTISFFFCFFYIYIFYTGYISGFFSAFTQTPFVSPTRAQPRPRLVPPLISPLPLPPPLHPSPLPPLETTLSKWTTRLVCSPTSDWGSASSREMYVCQSHDPQVITSVGSDRFIVPSSSVLLWNRNTRRWTWTLMQLLRLDPAEWTAVSWCWCRTQWTSCLLSPTWVCSDLFSSPSKSRYHRQLLKFLHGHFY